MHEQPSSSAASVCVPCGAPWEPYLNRCPNPDCDGLCSWGPAKGAQASSWLPDGSPKPNAAQPCPYCYDTDDPDEAPEGGWGPVCDVCLRGLIELEAKGY